MEITFEEGENILAVVPGLYQFEEDGLYHQAALAVTDSEVLFFDDSRPDSMTEDKAYYAIRRRFPISDIKNLSLENIKNGGKVKNMCRLNFILSNFDDSFVFYVRNKEGSYAVNFAKYIKKHKISTSRRDVDLKREG